MSKVPNDKLEPIAAQLGDVGLAPALAYFRPLIGCQLDDDKTIEARMLAAAKFLQEWLALYGGLEEWGFEIPDCVDDISWRLEELIPFLSQHILDRGSGDGRRIICAGVIVEAYRLLHGDDIPIHSIELRQACEDLWQACDNPTTQTAKGAAAGAEVGDNWRRFLERVRDGDEWVRGRLELYKTPEKNI
ncbi:MAG: hypothetical protein WAV38_38710 [Xanthobacteraceae bacterium]